MQASWIENTLQICDERKIDSKEAFASYWQQISEVNKLNPVSVFEVGVGNRFVSSYLKRLGYNIVTLDIIRGLNPSVVSSALTLPFHDKTFDVSLCCEVLEHLPYDCFVEALCELQRVTKRALVLSLPDVSYCLTIKLAFRNLPKLPFKLHWEWYISVPRLYQRDYPFNGQHYWDIGKKDYPLKNIRAAIAESGFSIVKTYLVIVKYDINDDSNSDLTPNIPPLF